MEKKEESLEKKLGLPELSDKEWYDKFDSFQAVVRNRDAWKEYALKHLHPELYEHYLKTKTK